jgi:imidazole glycerol phosphate synthase glutamine amidotransferase subunit
MKKPVLVIASTGAANLASVVAMCERSGVEPILTRDPGRVADAEKLLLPGVGAFGAAMDSLGVGGLDKVLAWRIEQRQPTMGICLGMQLFCETSQEAPGVAGIGAVPCKVERFSPGLALPQLGWNRVKPAPGEGFIEAGWAYFANSYRIVEAPEGYSCAYSSYGERFVAALTAGYNVENGIPSILLCQFHPELSGAWGQRLFMRWMGLKAGTADSRYPAELSEKPGTASLLHGTALRILPCLDIKGGRVVKGTKFQNLVDSGDPVELAARYEAEGADEIALLDISATIEERRTALESVAAVRKRLSIPISVGGGIRSVEDAERLLNAGADRVSVNSAAVRNPDLVRDLAERFGVQCVIVAIDAARKDGGGWEVFIEAGEKATGIDAVQWAAQCAGRGAGEILLTSIDRDGTGLGYDEELIAAVAEASGIPVIASGGATRTEHFLKGAVAGASALLGAGAFHRGELSIGTLKQSLSAAGMEVRQ